MPDGCDSTGYDVCSPRVGPARPAGHEAFGESVGLRRPDRGADNPGAPSVWKTLSNGPENLAFRSCRTKRTASRRPPWLGFWRAG